MEEMVTQYLENSYYVIFSTPASFWCLDKATRNKMGLTSLVKETSLIFGDTEENLNIWVYRWITAKTEALQAKADLYLASFYNGEKTIEEINDLIMQS